MTIDQWNMYLEADSGTGGEARSCDTLAQARARLNMLKMEKASCQ